MNSKTLADNQGVALLITLAVIAVVVTAALEINRRARSDAVYSAALGKQLVVSQMAASGVHLAMALLVKDRRESKTDSVQEAWADPESIQQYLGDFPFDAGQMSVKITDERAKIQVNALVIYPEGRFADPGQYRIWTRFAQQMAMRADLPEAAEPLTLVHSLKDWLDRNDGDAVTGLTGAESDYYRDLDPPYSCRNGPIPHLGELARVKGVSSELLAALGGIEGISRYLSVYGLNLAAAPGPAYDGRININTADVTVLSVLLPETHVHLAQAIADYREASEGGAYRHSLLQPDWYREVPGAGDLTIDPKLITVSSDVFRIEAAAGLDNRLATISAVVRREQDPESGRWKCRVLQWDEE